MRTRKSTWMASGLLALAFTAPTIGASAPVEAQRAERAPRGQAAATPSFVFATPPTIERLPNGLKVVLVPWPSPGVVSYNTVVRVGSRDEVEAGHSGFAHLFEHMMFRGTERFPEEVYERTMQSVGADHNAFTSNDLTFYTASIPSTALPRLMELEADRFQNLRYTEQQYRTETGAVLGEYNKSAANPELKLEETLNELAFTRHTYGHTTIGYLRDVQAMPGYFDYSREFFRRFYTPDNCTLVVVGDFDAEAVLRDVRTLYGQWRGRRDEPRIPVEPEPTAGAERHVEWPASTPPRVMIGYRTPSFDAGARGARRAAALRETAALQILHELLFSSSSPLYQGLVVERQRLLELSSWSGWFSRDPGLFVMQATLKPGTPFAEVRDAVQAEIDTIAQGRAGDARIRDVQSRLRYAMRMELETPGEVAQLIGRFVAASGDVRDVDAYLGALASVTPAEIASAASRYMTPARRFVVTLSERSAGGAQ